MKSCSDDEADRKLQAIIRIFCLLFERDIYIRAYSRFLGERLLNNTFLSKGLEERMLEMLKIECGAATMSKISKMFTDVEHSKVILREFQDKYGATQAGVSFQVQMMTQGSWQVEKSPLCEIPQPLRTCTEQFKVFYSQKHSHHRIDWLLHLGSCMVQPTFCTKPYQIVCSVFQAALLD